MPNELRHEDVDASSVPVLRAADWDEFAAAHITRPKQIADLFSSDISRFDVTDMTEVLEEAWELVEHDLICEPAFRRLTFSSTVALHGGMNPDFFKGTIVEEAAARELASLETR